MSSVAKQESVNSLIPFINKKLFDNTPADLSSALEALFVCSYDTGRLVSGLSHVFSAYNPILLHNLEIRIRRQEFAKLHSLKVFATHLSVNKSATSLFAVGPSATMILYHRHVLRRIQIMDQIHQRTLESLRKSQELIASEDGKEVIFQETTQPKSVNDTFYTFINNLKFNHNNKRESLLKHTTRNDGFICADPLNPDQPFYVPKNVISIQLGSRMNVSKATRDRLLKQANYILNLSNAERASHLEDLVEVKMITEKDCKYLEWPLEMVGQKGMFAKKDIPAFNIIGFYSGLYFTEKDSLNAYRKEAEQGYLIYVFGFPNQDFPRISGYMYGNDVTRINTATNYTGSAKEIAQKLFYIRNTFASYVKTTEYPDPEYVANPEMYDLVAYINDKPVKKGAQILVDYGIQYWKLKNPNITNATKEEIFDEYAKLSTIKKIKNKTAQFGSLSSKKKKSIINKFNKNKNNKRG